MSATFIRCLTCSSHCGPDFANLVIFDYEYNYVINLIDTGDTNNYHKLRYIFRYLMICCL